MYDIMEAKAQNHILLHEFMNNIGDWGKDSDHTYEEKDGLVLWSDPPEHIVHSFTPEELREYIPDLIDIEPLEIRECLGIEDDSDWDDMTVTGEEVEVTEVHRYVWTCPHCHADFESGLEPLTYLVCDNCNHIYKSE